MPATDTSKAIETVWKIERAKWLLGSEHQKDHSDAVNTLTDIVRDSPTLVEPQLLLAAALEKVDNVPGAIKMLQSAAELEPGTTAIQLELARLLQAHGRWDEARLPLFCVLPECQRSQYRHQRQRENQ